MSIEWDGRQFSRHTRQRGNHGQLLSSFYQRGKVRSVHLSRSTLMTQESGNPLDNAVWEERGNMGHRAVVYAACWDKERGRSGGGIIHRSLLLGLVKRFWRQALTLLGPVPIPTFQISTLCHRACDRPSITFALSLRSFDGASRQFALHRRTPPPALTLSVSTRESRGWGLGLFNRVRCEKNSVPLREIEIFPV